MAPGPGPYPFSKAARDMSVGIRKILFDNGGQLFKLCVVPRLHPMKRLKHGPALDVLVDRHEGMKIGYSVGDADATQTYSVPPYEHQTIVGPLYGLRKVQSKVYRVVNPFDLFATPITLGRWANIQVLQVGDTVMKAEEILRCLVVKEGAHVEIDEMKRHSMPAPVDVGLPTTTKKTRYDEKYRKLNWVLFGGLSYAHIFTLHVGTYLLRMTKVTLKSGRLRDLTSPRSSEFQGVIARAPSRMRLPDLVLSKDPGIGAVLRVTKDPADPFETVGDYSRPGRTCVSVPHK